MTQRESSTVLKVENLLKRFEHFVAVDSISFSINKGECFALLGPNGAGKTTTCEILEGLTAFDKGTISIFDLNYRENREEILSRIGVLLQETNLYKRFTVKETLKLFASFYKNSRDILPLVEKLGLGEKLNTQLRHLSGGLKQRVYIGCALVNDPGLVFLDEPTTGLDPQARRSIWQMIEDLKADQKSIFLTTHYMEEAAELADRVAIIDRGKIIAEGSPRELIAKYSEKEVLTIDLSLPGRSLAEISELLVGRLSWLKIARATSEKTLTVQMAEATQQIQEIIRACDSLSITIESFHMRQGTLEDVFLKLTGRRIRED